MENCRRDDPIAAPFSKTFKHFLSEMKVAIYSAVRRCLRSATMVLPPRARPSYWPRTFPRTLVKTCLLALGVLLWLLYFYSSNSTYDRRPPSDVGGDTKRADGFILRRPTVPLFEGLIEGDTSVAADDSSVVQGPSSGPKASSAPPSEPKAAPAPPTGPKAERALPNEVQRGDYAILENLLESRLRFGYNQSVTITTHATYELLDNLIYLSQRWQGPISVAVYAPHDDFKTALSYALWLRRCHSTIRDYVTFHFVYPAPEKAASSSDSNRQTATASAPSFGSPDASKVFQKPPSAALLASMTSPESATVTQQIPESPKMLPEAPKTLQNSLEPWKSIQMLPRASEAFRNPPDSASKATDNSSDASMARNNLPRAGKGSKNSSSKPLQHSPTASLESFQDLAGEPKVFLNSLGESKAIQTSTGIPNASQSSQDTSQYPPFVSSRAFQHSPVKLVKAMQYSPGSSNSSQNSPQSSKTLEYSLDATSTGFQNSLEGPAAFQQPRLGYERLAQDIIRRYGNAYEATVPSCDSTSFSLPRSYRHRHGLPYPINVCRNVARLSAKTHFVLASDIELYPSANVVPTFLEFSRRMGLVQRPGWEATERSPASSLASFFLRGPVAASMHPVRRVYVLPIFEVDKSVGTVPATKAALVELYRRKKAVYFHKHVCSFCNIIPRLNRWLVAPVPRGHHLGVFMSIKRHKPFNRWEPIYIGTNSEPLYDERLSWEGQQDKMTQMYELCLMNYDLAILDNAFLVHRPGIKTKNATEYKLKSQFIAQNNKIYKNIIADLENKHGTNSWCK